MANEDADENRLAFIESQLQKHQTAGQVMDAAASVRDISRKGVGKFIGTAIPPLVVNIARTDDNLEVVIACLEALKPMSVWPEGRCELRMCGCLQVIESCFEWDDKAVKKLSLEILANLAIDETVCEYTKATPLLTALSDIILSGTCESTINSALGALVNICLADDEALFQISQKDFALKLISIVHDQKGTRVGYRALLLLHHIMKAKDIGTYITEAIAAFPKA